MIRAFSVFMLTFAAFCILGSFVTLSAQRRQAQTQIDQDDAHQKEIRLEHRLTRLESIGRGLEKNLAALTGKVDDVAKQNYWLMLGIAGIAGERLGIQGFQLYAKQRRRKRKEESDDEDISDHATA